MTSIAIIDFVDNIRKVEPPEISLRFSYDKIYQFLHEKKSSTLPIARLQVQSTFRTPRPSQPKADHTLECVIERIPQPPPTIINNYMLNAILNYKTSDNMSKQSPTESVSAYSPISDNHAVARRRKSLLNVVWPPQKTRDIGQPSHYQRRSSNPEVEMRRHCEDFNIQIRSRPDYISLCDPSSREKDWILEQSQEKSNVTNAHSSSLGQANSLSLSTIRAMSIPVTPGTVKSKRDFITRSSPDSVASSSMHSNRCQSPGTGNTVPAGTIAGQWRMNPPFSADGNSFTIRSQEEQARGDSSYIPVRASLTKCNNNHATANPKRKLVLQNKWPPRPKDKRSGNVDSNTMTPNIQVCPQVKSLRSHFEKYSCSPGDGTPLAFRMAQEMYERLSPLKTPKPVGDWNKTMVLHPIQPESTELTSSRNDQATRTELYREASRKAADVVATGDLVESSKATTLSVTAGAPLEDPTFAPTNQEISSGAVPSTVDLLEHETPIQDRLPVQEHFADIILPSGQKLPPPKGRQRHRRTNYRIRYEGPTLLRLDDVYGHLLDIPEVDDRFLAEPKDSMATLPQRRGQSPRPVRDHGCRANIAKAKGDSTPVHPRRQDYDSESDSIFSACSGDLHSVFCEAEDREERLGDSTPTSNEPNYLGSMMRPDVWITPIKANNTKRRWKVKRVWDVEDVDDEEEEYSVDHDDLMDKIKSLLGVPEQFGQTSEEWDIKIDNESPWEIDGKKDSAPWYVKRVYDIDGEIDSSDEEGETILSIGRMAEAIKKIVESCTNDSIQGSSSHPTSIDHDVLLVLTVDHPSAMASEIIERNEDTKQNEDVVAGPEFTSNQNKPWRHTVRAFARPDDWVSPVPMFKPKKKSYVVKGERATNKNQMARVEKDEAAKFLLPIDHGDNSSLHKCNQFEPKDDLRESVKVKYRRHSTGDIPDKDLVRFSESKRLASSSRKSKDNDRKAVLSCVTKDNGWGSSNVRNDNFANKDRKARCSSLHTPGTTPKPRKEVKMWWHE